jgi:pimeloyl-ACP methyl ester carboxylesterase
MSISKKSVIFVLAALSSVCGCGSDGDETGGKKEPPPDTQGVADLAPLPLDVALPIVFVHGFAGSAQQYESQAIRFAANGYPRDRIRALDHDGQGQDYETYANLVDELVDQVRAEFGVEKLFLVGHSRGTTVSNTYLGDPARAAKIAKYVSLDGRGCDVAPAAGVPCLEPNQEGLPGQAHVEVATSAESFAMQYQFLVGEAPAVVDIVRQPKPVVISGRAVNFPQNTGRAGATLAIWEIDSETGTRVGAEPVGTFEIGADGNWGPLEVDPDKRYEQALALPDAGNQHFYFQRYLRSSHFVRLLTGPTDSPIRLATHRGAGHAAVIAMRMREWYATDDPDEAGDESDVLEIGTASAAGNQPPVNVVSARMENGAIAMHLHDDSGSPGESTLASLPNFEKPECALLCNAFQTNADVFMPAADPPNGTITVKNLPRGDASKPQILSIPNWASTDHLVTLMFSDYPQE